jgi:phosphoglycolate phosphatase
VNLDAIIFDLDGTLVDSLADLADSMNEVLQAAAMPVHPTLAYRRYVGDGIATLVRRALPANSRDEQTVGILTQRMRDAYKLRWNQKTRPYPGIAEMLTELGDRSVPLAVLSNKPQPMTCKVVSELLRAWQFAVVVGAEAGFARKPDPGGALEIAHRLNTAPNRMAYIGDSDTDMLTAKAAGMYAVGALWGFRDGAELAAAGADRLIGHPMQVTELFHTSERV